MENNAEKEYNISLRDHDDAVKLSGDENPLHSLQKYMMGAHLLSLIETHPEIKNMYIQHLKVGFKNPVIIKEKGNKIVYEINKQSEPHTFLYTLNIKEDNNLILNGEIHATDDYDFFKYESKNNLEKQMKNGLDAPKISDLKITPEMIKEYQRLIFSKNMTDEEYNAKYGGNKIPSTITPFFIPAEIIRMLKSSVGDLNTGKKYIYASQDIEFYSTEAYGEGIQLLGKRPENLEKKSKCYIDIFVNGLEGIIAKSRTLALAYS